MELAVLGGGIVVFAMRIESKQDVTIARIDSMDKRITAIDEKVDKQNGKVFHHAEKLARIEGHLERCPLMQERT